nr:hypothetical protein CFP56_46691 [Quercus suber]
MQKQTLHDAWRYMDEKDPVKLRLLETELDRPDFRRWQSWFDLAKKQKKTKIQTAETRKRNRKNRERGAKQGVTEDDSDPDSAFGEDQAEPTRGESDRRERRASNVRGFNGSAGLREGLSNDTRRPADGQPKSKRQRKGPFILDDDDDDSNTEFVRQWTSSRLPAMSGGLPNSSTSSKNPIIIEDDDADDQSVDYDPRAPKDQNSDLISPSPDPTSSRMMPPAKGSWRKSADGQKLSPLHASIDSGFIGLRGTMPGHLPTPYSQGTPERTNGFKPYLENIDTQTHAKSAHSDRDLKRHIPNRELFQLYNGVDNMEQAMQEAMQQSRESLARESLAPEPHTRSSSKGRIGTDGDEDGKKDGIGNSNKSRPENEEVFEDIKDHF